LSENRKLRIGPLNSVNSVRRELGKCYREARRGEIGIDELRAFTYCLKELRESLVISDIETRLETLEESADLDQSRY